jgi:hypothetical protein
MRHYRTALAKTLAEWDRLGQAPGRICGFIEGAQVRRGHRETTLKKRGRKGHA